VDFKTEQVSSKMKAEFKAICFTKRGFANLSSKSYIGQKRLFYNSKNGQHELKIQITKGSLFGGL